MALIQPFVGGVDFNDLKKRQVIVVHQSAKEFIVNELAFVRSGPQYAERCPASGGKSTALSTQSRLENNIFNICVQYLLLDEIDNIPLFSDKQIAINKLPQNLDLFSDQNDATAYTADCFLYDPLSIISLYGSKELLLKMLEVSDFESSEFLCDTAFLAVDQVLQWGDLCRLQLLFFGRRTGCHLQNLDFFRRVIDVWRFSCNNNRWDWDAAFGIVNDIPDVLVTKGWGNELFCLAASQGCLPVIERLMEISQHNAGLRKELLRGPQRQPRSLTNRVHQSIGEAVLGGHMGVVEYLLQQDGIEAHLHHRNANGENVLHLASVQCDPAMFRVLAPNFLGRMESAKTLISLSTTYGIARLTENNQEALQMAESMRDEAMCDLLKGLDSQQL
ncbi:hypothetical protein K456DRAFT_1745546 [Colletotrichum gloeosporioides 23]|nr:hypothetical protein K456DRAFT_1745546 [Colletotrichum gloeosporioides 23]